LIRPLGINSELVPTRAIGSWRPFRTHLPHPIKHHRGHIFPHTINRTPRCVRALCPGAPALGAARPEIPDVDVVATDGDRHQVGVRCQGGRLGACGTQRYVLGPRAPAAHIGVVADAECCCQARRAITGGAPAAHRIDPLHRYPRPGRVGIPQRHVTLSGTHRRDRRGGGQPRKPARPYRTTPPAPAARRIGIGGSALGSP
jgi:hypothetical protein